MTEEKRTYWDAETYEKIGTPMRAWAQQVIEDLALRGDETVLDAGCGSGSVTLDLWEKLPKGRIYAVDGSPQMIEKLKRTLAERGIENIVALQSDLTKLQLTEQVDIVFSNAVFHWIPDDDGLFGSLARAAKPGGRLRAQCGGAGNNKRLMSTVRDIEAREPYAEHLRGRVDTRKYRSSGQAREALERNGWRDARAETFGSPVTFGDTDSAILYLRTIILQQQASALDLAAKASEPGQPQPQSLSDRFLREVVAEVEKRHGSPFVADYVRLDLWATRK
ncbi:MAG: methyltransferase domain-containing protein [Chloroflexota bacterium]|nr:methyltransferase domain-containing protein [Chloroflexota bacterium]